MEDKDHTWVVFLDARLKVIKYMVQQGKSDALIAQDLSMTESQVFSIRSSPYPDALKKYWKKQDEENDSNH